MKTMYLILILLGLGSVAEAQPVKDAKCASGIKVKAPKNGAGVFFDKDCKVAYVLPPVNGEINLEAIAKTSNLAVCEQVDNLMKGLTSISRSWRNLAEDLERARKPNPGNGGGSPLFPNPSPPPGGMAGFDMEAWKKQLDALLDQYSSYLNRLQPFNNMPAATAQFSYSVGHIKIVEAYQKLNPKITFEPITLRESRIYLARIVGTDQDRAIYPAVVYTSLPGYGAAKDGTDAGEDRGIFSGEAQSGQIGFSATGICPYYDAQKNAIPEMLAGRELAANMVANVRYVYELSVARKYKLTYNMAAMLRKLQESESHSGFFTTSSVNRLIVERSDKEVFNIEVESEDGRWQYDDTMAQTLKAQLLDRVFKDLELVTQGAPGDAPAASAPKSNGADVAAEEVGKCPYVYCQIASGVLRVASAIWGGSNAVNEYINKVDVVKTETSEDRRMLTYRGTVNFTPKKSVSW